MANKKLISDLLNMLDKESFVPPTPAVDPNAAPPVDPAVMGMPPADPAAMGMPPVDPAMAGMPPVDPAAMGMPPMDPAAMGMPPMDPAAMGMPPMDPAAMGMPPVPGAEAGIPVMLNMEDLKAVMEEAKGGERLDLIENMLTKVMHAMNIPVPEIPEAPAEEGLAAEAAPEAAPEGGLLSPDPTAPPAETPLDAGFTEEALKVASAEDTQTEEVWRTQMEDGTVDSPILGVLRGLNICSD